MGTRRWLAAAALVAGSVAGCGTVENLAHVEQPTRPYGGVASDLTACRDIIAPSEPQPEGYFPGKHLILPTIRGVCCCIRLADVPVSLVTDTLTLPIALSQAGTQEMDLLGSGGSPPPTSELVQGQPPPPAAFPTTRQ